MYILEQALTFDDVLLIPSYSEVLPSSVSLHTQLTSKIKLNIPIMSAAMDTVTEANLAIAIAQEGGIGIIHKNLNPDLQAAHVAKVKRFESGILKDPITVHANQTIGEVLELAKQYGISGFPVLDSDDKQVVGVITTRDMRFEVNLSAIVADKMTPKEKLITLNKKNQSLEAA